MTQQESNKNSQFLKIQKDLAITKTNFDRKFMFSQSQISDGYLLSRFNPCPSQLQGFTIQEIQMISAYGSQLIFQAGVLLKIPVSTSIVAQSIFHYFYSRKSFIDYDYRDIAMGATFLACKSQQTLRKSYQIAAVYDQLFKIFQGQRRPVKPLDPNSIQYSYLKKIVIKSQTDILFELGFQVYKLFDIPHRYISGFLNVFDKHSQIKKIATKAWAYLNDIYQTRMCLYYTGQNIAAAAIYLSLRTQKIVFPKIPWWCLMQTSLEFIEDICSQVLSLIKIGKSLTMQKTGNIIKQVSQKKHGITNVFPVPYYRKIMLDNRNKIKIKVDEAVYKPEQVTSKNEHKKYEKLKTQSRQKQKDKRRQRSRDKYHRKNRDRDSSDDSSQRKHRRDRKDRDKKKDKYHRQRSKSRQRSYSRDNQHKRDKRKHKNRHKKSKRNHSSSQSQSTFISQLEQPKLKQIKNDKAKSKQKQNPKSDIEKQNGKKQTLRESSEKEGMKGLIVDKNLLKKSLNSLMIKHEHKMINIQKQAEKIQKQSTHEKSQPDHMNNIQKQLLSQSQNDSDLQLLAELKQKIKQKKANYQQ